MSSAPRHAGAPSASPPEPVPGRQGERAPGGAAPGLLTSRRHVDYGRVRSAICPA